MVLNNRKIFRHAIWIRIAYIIMLLFVILGFILIFKKNYNLKFYLRYDFYFFILLILSASYVCVYFIFISKIIINSEKIIVQRNLFNINYIIPLNEINDIKIRKQWITIYYNLNSGKNKRIIINVFEYNKSKILKKDLTIISEMVKKNEE